MRSSPIELTMPMAMRSADEADELVARIREGDVAALGVAYDLHHEPVRAFARRLVGSEEQAEDLVHETFLSLPGALSRFLGMASLRTFLISIAANHAKHHVRSAARRRAAMARLALVEPDEPKSPEHGASERELARALSRALDSLPLDQRIAFVLCEVEERTAPEAAAIVHAPEATVRTRLFHARQKLREVLQREGYR